MFFIIGVVVVAACVIGGYIGAGGHLSVLWQPFEFVIIFGAAFGAFIISNSKKVMSGVAGACGKLVRGPRHTKASYLDLLTMLYMVFKLAKAKGDLALESHVDNPSESNIFQSYPSFAKDHHAVEFLCDYLRLLTLGAPPPHEVEAVMDAELEVHHVEAHAPCGAMQSMADALPALGIVAAVLGVIHTMGSITEPPEVLGHLIGGALVGTFTGVLAAYGVVGPVAKSMENNVNAESHYITCIKMGILAHMQGYAPQVSVEFARKSLNTEVRPSFAELEDALQNAPAPT